LGEQAEDDLEDDEARVEGDADEKGAAEVGGSMRVGMSALAVVMVVTHAGNAPGNRWAVNRIDVNSAAV
jgi:hypothetical protein